MFKENDEHLTGLLMTPRVSLCIISNSGLLAERSNYLKQLISSISLAGFPEGRTEIIVCGAVSISNPFVRILSFPELAATGQVCALRNRAVDAAAGEWIIHCDDDILFTPGYWGAVENSVRGDVDILCTKIFNPNGTRFWDWAAYIHGRGQTLLPYSTDHEFTYATGGHGIYRREIFKKVRWDETFRHGGNEEFKFSADARAAGLRFSFCEKAAVYLQYHHCDAQAAIDHRTQVDTGVLCREFGEILSGTKASSRTEALDLEIIDRLTSPKSLYEGISLYKRIGFKLAVHDPILEKVSVSVITCCNRYLQRFRIFSQSLCRQNFDLSGVEIIVANPHSPDGLSAYLSMLGEVYEKPIFKEVLIDKAHFRNRGLMIQQALNYAQGNIVIGMDCDLILPPEFLERLVNTVTTNPSRVVGVYRNFLSARTTKAILAGKLDPWSEFSTLLKEDVEEPLGFRGVLGYCQAATRIAWKQAGYPMEFDEIAKSDVEFNERLAKIGVTPLFLEDLKVLHLNHERNWMGTDGFL